MPGCDGHGLCVCDVDDTDCVNNLTTWDEESLVRAESSGDDDSAWLANRELNRRENEQNSNNRNIQEI